MQEKRILIKFHPIFQRTSTEYYKAPRNRFLWTLSSKLQDNIREKQIVTPGSDYLSRSTTLRTLIMKVMSQATSATTKTPESPFCELHILSELGQLDKEPFAPLS